MSLFYRAPTNLGPADSLTPVQREISAMSGSDDLSDASRPSLVSVFRGHRHDAAGGNSHDITPAPRAAADLDIGENNHPIAVFDPLRMWNAHPAVELDLSTLMQSGLFAASNQSPFGSAFDLLRTQVAQAMKERGWSRLGVTSPTRGCGKSYIAANLALSLARLPDSRTALVDLDLAQPNLHRMLGLTPRHAMKDYLAGHAAVESVFLRVGTTLACGLNGDGRESGSEILHAATSGKALTEMERQLLPDISIFDLPPALSGDEVLAMHGKLDAVLLVADGSRTTAKDIRACEALFANRIPLMGVILNRAEDAALRRKRDR